MALAETTAIAIQTLAGCGQMRVVIQRHANARMICRELQSILGWRIPISAT